MTTIEFFLLANKKYQIVCRIKKQTCKKTVADFTEINNEIIGRRGAVSERLLAFCFSSTISVSAIPCMVLRTVILPRKSYALRLPGSFETFTLQFWGETKTNTKKVTVFTAVAYDRNPVCRQRTEICGQV